MRYLFLGYSDANVVRDWTPGELEAVIERHAAFGARMREEGKFVAGVGLDAHDDAAVVRRRGDDYVVTEGPFAETNEQIGGLYVLECADRDEALGLAKQMPFSDSMSIEVRPAPH
jgi:hypothetical protein